VAIAAMVAVVTSPVTLPVMTDFLLLLEDAIFNKTAARLYVKCNCNYQ
jgi:hypothetical protein